MKAFPFFKQTEAYDCGPACLKMICAFFEKQHSIEYIKNISGLSERGVSMYNLEQAAKRLGFESFGVKYSIEELFKSQLPCIIHWNTKHFVVVPPQKFTGNEILIANPATGLQHISKEDFLKCWLGSSPGNGKGYVLHVQNKIKKKLFSARESFRYFARYLFPYRSKLMIILALLAIAGVITFIHPFISKNIIDQGINKKEIYFVITMLIVQVFLFIGNTSIEMIKNWIMLHINNNFGISILHDFLLKLTKLPISYFDKKNVGDLQQRIFDHTRIQYFLTSNSVSIIFSLVNFISLFATLAYFNTSILAIIILFSSVNVLWILYFLKRRKEIDYARFYNRGNNQDNINEIILGMQDIKLNNLEKYKIDKWYKTQEKQNALNFKMMKVDQKQSIGSSSLDQLENIVISFFSALAVIKGNMTLGMMMSISLIAGQLKGTITQFLYLIRSYQEASISLDRLMEIHKNKNEDEDSPGLILPNPEIDTITIENVSFKYTTEGPYILKNINLKIPKGATVAIVGGSGSGKSTLLKLLLKYNYPTEGNVFVNKINLKDISSKWWWQHCGAVMQEGYIFSDTIENNIAIHENAAEMAKMKTAKTIANISEFIESMPSKGETMIGSNGSGISGGQKQKLLIARAVYKNPEILFFDEATSSLDLENEERIMQNIDHFFRNKTRIIIAHRLTTIKNADKIVVLDEGEIIETGTHEQLMLMRGKYFNLFSRQVVLENS